MPYIRARMTGRLDVIIVNFQRDMVGTFRQIEPHDKGRDERWRPGTGSDQRPRCVPKAGAMVITADHARLNANHDDPRPVAAHARIPRTLCRSSWLAEDSKRFTLKPNGSLRDKSRRPCGWNARPSMSRKEMTERNLRAFLKDNQKLNAMKLLDCRPSPL